MAAVATNSARSEWQKCAPSAVPVALVFPTSRETDRPFPLRESLALVCILLGLALLSGPLVGQGLPNCDLEEYTALGGPEYGLTWGTAVSPPGGGSSLAVTCSKSGPRGGSDCRAQRSSWDTRKVADAKPVLRGLGPCHGHPSLVFLDQSSALLAASCLSWEERGTWAIWLGVLGFDGSPSLSFRRVTQPTESGQFSPVLAKAGMETAWLVWMETDLAHQAATARAVKLDARGARLSPTIQVTEEAAVSSAGFPVGAASSPAEDLVVAWNGPSRSVQWIRLGPEGESTSGKMKGGMFRVGQVRHQPALARRGGLLGFVWADLKPFWPLGARVGDTRSIGEASVTVLGGNLAPDELIGLHKPHLVAQRGGFLALWTTSTPGKGKEYESLWAQSLTFEGVASEEARLLTRTASEYGSVSVSRISQERAAVHWLKENEDGSREVVGCTITL